MRVHSLLIFSARLLHSNVREILGVITLTDILHAYGISPRTKP